MLLETERRLLLYKMNDWDVCWNSQKIYTYMSIPISSSCVLFFLFSFISHKFVRVILALKRLFYWFNKITNEFITCFDILQCRCCFYIFLCVYIICVYKYEKKYQPNRCRKITTKSEKERWSVQVNDKTKRKENLEY